MAELFERGAQFDALSERIADGRAGRGSVVLLAGEAGAGKSTLVSAFARTVAADTRVLVGACDPLSTPRPLGPVRD
ncbi:MAG: AAA family ATPase, partial [Acidimicrobiales bacterium]|nr:AAA family ATPase [Acidimicrobiales bacterium]